MNQITINTLNHLKETAEKITCLTAYDASFAQIINQTKIEVILVGDSLGTVIQGFSNTIPVSVQDIIYHTKAVSRVSDYSLIVADMPFMSYAGVTVALKNAEQILKKGGAQMVKLEGACIEAIEALSNNGVAVCGHLGLLPQSVNQIGAYKIVGKNKKVAEQILKDALAIQKAGAKLLVLECVPKILAKTITDALDIPTIGIGAGLDCDGQVLVLYDLLNISINQSPTFSKNYLQNSGSIQQAIADFATDVKNKKFPSNTHSF